MTNTNDPQLENLIKDADALWEKNKSKFFDQNGNRLIEFSDLTDHHGRQVIDLVQEGGGVLGIALVGFTYILEKAKLRFVSLAGTSAGAINSMLISVVSDEDANGQLLEGGKSKKIAGIIASKPFADFLDGNDFMKWICTVKFSQNTPWWKKALLNLVLFVLLFLMAAGEFMLFKMAMHFIERNISNAWTSTILIWLCGSVLAFIPLALIYFFVRLSLGKNIGLFRGDAFHNWLRQIIEEEGIPTYNELKKRRISTMTFKDRKGNDAIVKRRLVLMVSDITNNRIAKMPEESMQYWVETKDLHPADFVRASMSIPFFFQVFMPGPHDNVKLNARFVDGGMLSNFPIREFHNNAVEVPRFPTFGVRLGLPKEATFDRYLPLKKYLAAMVATFRRFYDDAFLESNEETKYIVTHIDTRNSSGKEISSLGFKMSDETKRYLFNQGAQTAIDFLLNFDWEGYKAFRKKEFDLRANGEKAED